MKTKILKMLAAMALAGSLAAAAQGQGRIATIDLRKIFDNYWKRQQAESALTERRTSMDKELKGFQDDYTKTREDYTKLLAASQDQSKSVEEREKSKTAAEKKLLEVKTSENTMRAFVENAQDQLRSQLKRMDDSLLQDIQAAVGAKAKATGYALVLDTSSESANRTPTVMYSSGENDLTAAILAQLNAGAPAFLKSTNSPDGITKDKK